MKVALHHLSSCPFVFFELVFLERGSSGARPACRRFMKRFKVSNQKGAPSEMAKMEMPQPKICITIQGTTGAREPERRWISVFRSAKSADHPVTEPMRACSSAETGVVSVFSSLPFSGFLGSSYTAKGKSADCSGRAWERACACSTTLARNAESFQSRSATCNVSKLHHSTITIA